MDLLREQFIEASQYGDVKKVKRLLEQGINFADDKASYGKAMYRASKNGHIEIMKLLILNKDKACETTNSDMYNCVFRWSSRDGHLKIVRSLLSNPKVNVSNGHNYAIRYASQNGHIEIVKLLLKTPGIDPSDYHNYAIRWASYNNHYNIVKLLLSDNRVNPLEKSINDKHSALDIVIKENHLEILKLIKNWMIIKTFHKLNKIVCFERIKKFLLKNVVLRPDSVYIRRLVDSF
jgi:ankyrin repeat protein